MITFSAVALGAVLVASGPVYRGTEQNIRVEIPRVDATIQVDGSLSEPVWEQAARLTGFSQYSPDDGRPASNETDVLVWYSATAMHFGVRAHAAPGTVRATLAERDRIDNDDWIQIYLGTFNDGRQASVFGVNPLGVQMDGAMVEGTDRGSRYFGGLAGGRSAPDLSPDFVFESKGHVTDYGYEVEVRIPFKSLRYQSAAAQNWGVHVIRRIQSTGHEDSWSPARRSAASFLEQSGTLAGLTGLRRGLVMDLNPAITARADGGPSPDGWAYDGQSPDAGGNLRWGVTSNLTLNATVNPDFSQIEADATQFQLDPRQALFFAEKRPFFLDGIEFFSTPGNLVYSRRIVAPLAAVKVTGKLAGTTVAALTAVDDETQSLTDGHPVFNIARVQRDFGSASRAGVLYTNRLEGGFGNHVAATDAHLVWRKVYSLDLQAAVSRTSVQGVGTGGALWQASLNRTGRRFSLRYSLAGNDPGFQAALGFIGRREVVNGELTNQLALFGKRGSFVEKWTGDIKLLGTWNYRRFFDTGQALERKLHMNSNVLLRGGWQTGLSVLVERYRFDAESYAHYAVLDGATLRPFVGQTLPNLDYVATLNTPRVHGLSANGFYIWGRDENFFEWSSADIRYATLGVQWRPSERLRADVNYNMQSFARRTDGSYVGIRRIPRVRLEYQATRALFLRYVGEYATNYQDALRDDSRTGLPLVFVRPDGTFAPATGVRQRTFRNDWLLSYQPAPGTVVFAGYGNALLNTDPARARELRRTRDGFFLKVSYLFRL
ncbi:MAG: carbohydrate binding family 9 domain-containing protein [Acidobacteria bacterium]|nr:carbohydrate binding family 9 domain-containing protein [Acidobacteriota bacterium]